MPAHWLMGDSPKEDGEKGDSTQPVNNDDGNDDDAGSASANPKLSHRCSSGRPLHYASTEIQHR